jgi:Icc protein
MKEKYLWYTDTHLNGVPFWTKANFIYHIRKENPKGIFLTGDISTGLTTKWDLKLLTTFIKCPIYFVLGNHDYHLSSFEKTHFKIKELCNQHPNLIWLTQSEIIKLSDEVALIGSEGWYDATIGNPKYLKASFDWMLIKELRQLPNMIARLKAFQELSNISVDIIISKLKKALDEDYKTIYILTHFPPWKEATSDVGTILVPDWLPYNVNLRLGQAIEDVMKAYKKRHVIVLAGHTHTDAWIHVARNIECKVNKAKYYGSIRNEEHIFI